MSDALPTGFADLAAANADTGWTPALLFGLTGGIDLRFSLRDDDVSLCGERAPDDASLSAAFPEWTPGVPLPPPASLPLDTRVVDVLRRTAERLDRPATPDEGMEGLARLVDTLPTLGVRPDARSLASRLHQQIHGTQALRRRLYRDFLLDAAPHAPLVGRLQLSISMTRVGDAWQTLGEELRQVAEDPQVDFAQAATYALAVQTFEETFWERILQAL